MSFELAKMLEFGFYEKEVGVMQHFDQFEDEIGDQLRAEFELRIGKNVTFQFLGFCCLDVTTHMERYLTTHTCTNMLKRSGLVILKMQVR